jgi:uncharacterized membrane protein YhfC
MNSISWILYLASSCVFPLLVGFFYKHRFGARWRTFVCGIVVYAAAVASQILFILVLRLFIVSDFASVTGRLRFEKILNAISSGVFEEVARYIGFGWFFAPEQLNLPLALMYGTGHSWLESFLLAAGFLERRISREQKGIAVLAISSSGLLLSAVARLCSLAAHTFLSVVVEQARKPNQKIWLLYAICYHSLADVTCVLVLWITGKFAWVVLIQVAWASASVYLLFKICSRAGLWRDLKREETVAVREMS